MKKIFALYLPQFHVTKENNEWWGEGYTEWNAVKEAKSLYHGHVQPRVPLDDRYYDLSDESAETLKWQAMLAKKFGITGFCIYHYWFKNCKKMLEKPMEILLNHPEIDIEYFVCWANEPWKRTWYGNTGQILLEQEYGTETEWKEHYKYLRQFFFDKRYRKINNKPVIAVYKTADIKSLPDMRSLWDVLAQKDGFDGIYLLGAKTAFEQEKRRNLIDGEYLFEPQYTMHYQYGLIELTKKMIYRFSHKLANLITQKNSLENMECMKDLYRRLKLPDTMISKDLFYGICPSWDNTPRKQYKGTVFRNSSPKLFKQKLVEMLRDDKAGDMIMINAWNEWSEGAYLEPDTFNRYGYLEAVKEALQEVCNK
jgi:hypothetical protein